MKVCIIAALSFLAFASLSAEACTLVPVLVSSEAHGGTTSYSGSRPGLTISWKESDEEPANHVTVKNVKTGKSCDLAGWPIRRDEMYLSDDGSTFVLVDGIDDDDAEFYKLDTCQRAERAHLTARPQQYFIAPTMVGTYGFCDALGKSEGFHCYPAAIYAVGDDCLPHYDAAKSAALTKSVFGVAFTETSHVSHLGTAKATATPDGDAIDLPAPNAPSPTPNPGTASPPPIAKKGL